MNVQTGRIRTSRFLKFIFINELINVLLIIWLTEESTDYICALLFRLYVVDMLYVSVTCQRRVHMLLSPSGLTMMSPCVSLQEAGSQRLKTDVDLGCNFFVQAEVWAPHQSLWSTADWSQTTEPITVILTKTTQGSIPVSQFRGRDLQKMETGKMSGLQTTSW